MSIMRMCMCCARSVVCIASTTSEDAPVTRTYFLKMNVILALRAAAAGTFGLATSVFEGRWRGGQLVWARSSLTWPWAGGSGGRTT